MNEPPRMPFGDGIADLRSELDGAPHVHRTPGHLISQGRPGSELVGEIALVAFFDHVEERRDVRMVQRLRGARLFEKFTTAVRSGDELGRRHHQGHRASDLEIARAIDVAEGSGAETFQDVVVGDRLHVGGECPATSSGAMA